MEEPISQIQRIRPGCGVQGCLFAAVAIFVLLLVGTLVIAVFRFSEPPAGPPGMPVGVTAPSDGGPLPRHLSGRDPEPATGGRRPTRGAEGSVAAHA